MFRLRQILRGIELVSNSDNKVSVMIERIRQLTITYQVCFERNFDRWDNKLGNFLWRTPPSVIAIPTFMGQVDYQSTGSNSVRFGWTDFCSRPLRSLKFLRSCLGKNRFPGQVLDLRTPHFKFWLQTLSSSVSSIPLVSPQNQANIKIALTQPTVFAPRKRDKNLTCKQLVLIL